MEPNRSASGAPALSTEETTAFLNLSVWIDSEIAFHVLNSCSLAIWGRTWSSSGPTIINGSISAAVAFRSQLMRSLRSSSSLSCVFNVFHSSREIPPWSEYSFLSRSISAFFSSCWAWSSAISSARRSLVCLSLFSVDLLWRYSLVQNYWMLKPF